MATHSNSGPVEGDAERGIAGRGWQRDTSYSTRAVRDITYKIIPFCSLCLVIFSVGAILASTLAFDKPIPRQGTIVISSILLSFFVLFSIGFMYLYFRKFRPHISNPRDPTGHSDRHLGDHFRNIARRFERPSASFIPNTAMTSHARPRGSGGGVIPSDVLRDPAPSPNTYRNKTEERQNVAQGQNMVYELAGSDQQQDRHSAQQHKRETDETSRPGPSNPAREGDLEADQLPSGGEHNRSIPTSMASKLYVKQTFSPPYTRDIRNTLESPLTGDLGRPPFVTSNNYHTAGPQNHLGTPIQQGLPRRAHEPSPLSSPGSVRTGPRQFPSPFLEAPARSAAAPRSPAESGKQSGREDAANASPWPIGMSPKMDTRGKRPIGPRPMDGGLYISVNGSREGKLSTANTAVSNADHSPLTSEQVEPEPGYHCDNDKHFRRKSIPFNIASSLNGMHQDTSNRTPALPPQTFLVSTPNPTYPRYPATAPQPLQLPNNDQHYAPHAHTAYNRGKMKPQPRPISHEPPIYEVEEEGEEVPKIPVRALSREKMKGPRGGGQYRPRVPRRGSSRKFKRKILNTSRGLDVGLKGGKVMSESV
ncbi:hypothetical protein CHU98_g7180 [Xylaria longipes]|nr:hypothetical protein CHU98_g7180 [Xylaria longipes]